MVGLLLRPPDLPDMLLRIAQLSEVIAFVDLEF